MLNRLLSAISLNTRLPLKVKFDFDPARLDFWLPVVGLLPAWLNLLLWALLTATGNIPQRYPLLTAALLMVAQYWCCNLFHLDGLMDTADAFMGNVSAEKRQAILKDSRVGVYGFFAGFMALTLKLLLLGALLPELAGGGAFWLVAVFAFPVAARGGAALVPVLARPAHTSGLGALLRHSRGGRVGAGTLLALGLWLLSAGAGARLLALLPCALWRRLTFWPPDANTAALVIVAAGFLLLPPLGALFYARLYRRHLGGYTGDTLGATIETTELLYLGAAFIATAVNYSGEL